MDRGGVERARHQLPAAVADYQRALVIWTVVVGPDHPNAGTVHYYLGEVALEQDRVDDGLVELRRALAIWERALGADHPSLSAALDGIGDGLRAKGDPRGAISAYARAIVLLEKAEGPDHPDLAGGLTGEGLALLDLADAHRALPLLERARASSVANPGDPLDLARTDFALARALTATSGDRGRAHDLAEHARAAYAADDHAARELAAVVAWQAQHP
jgi:tetratricopeptide (TPR) repeat protein